MTDPPASRPAPAPDRWDRPTSGSAAPRYIAHLARDANPLETACGEPWQGWQAPAKLDLQPAWMPNRATLPPHDPPRSHVDAIRQCQACMRVSLHP